MPKYLDIHIDALELQTKLEVLKSVMQPKQFESAIYGVFKRTGGHVKTILRKDVPEKYQVKPGEVGEAVKSPQLSSGGNSLGCSIPIRATRRHFGGNHGFPAKGYARGWNSVKRGRYPVTVQVIKGQWSVLPYDMDKGAKPPFRNMPSKLQNVVYYRSAQPRLPINKAVGIGIPQMPMNRAKDDVQKDIADYLQERVSRRVFALMQNGR